MESEEGHQNLLAEVRGKIELLSTAVEEITEVKKSLKITGADVKMQIRDSISRHLETLRNRETWLLNQTEVIQHIKEDVLRQQQATLNQALGSLKSTFALLEESSENCNAIDMESLNGKIKENLVFVDELNLQPEETSFITFKSNNFQTQEAVKQFGRVNCDSHLDQQVMLSFQGLSLASSKIKTSCKDEQKLCNTTANIGPWLLNKSSGEAKNVLPTVAWPLSNLSTKDWLQQSTQPSTTGDSRKPLVSIPEIPSSPENWLARCQQEKLGESKTLIQERFREGSTWIKRCTSASSAIQLKDSGTGKYYQNIKSSDPRLWLIARNDISAALKTDLIGTTCARIMSSGMDQWLARIDEGKKGHCNSMDTDSSSCSDCTYCDIPDDESSITTTSSVCETSPDWLTVKKQVISPKEKLGIVKVRDIEEAPVFLVSKKPRLDSCDETPVDNVRNGMGLSMKNVASSDVEKWLHHSSNQNPAVEVKDNMPTFSCSGNTSETGSLSLESFYSNVLNSDNCKWLQKSSDSSESVQEKYENKSGIKQYIDSLSGDYNHWLSPNTSASKDDICKWLARTSTDKCKNCPKMCSKDLFKIFDEVSNMSEGWLLL